MQLASRGALSARGARVCAFAHLPLSAGDLFLEAGSSFLQSQPLCLFSTFSALLPTVMFCGEEALGSHISMHMFLEKRVQCAYWQGAGSWE